MKKEKKTELLQDALQYLDEDMIQAVDTLRGDASSFKFKSAEVDCSSPTEMGALNNKMETKQNADKIYRQIGEMIDENEKKKRNWKKWTTLAASICVFLTVAWIWNSILPQIDDVNGSHEGMQESTNINQGATGDSNSDPHIVTEDATTESVDKTDDLHTPLGEVETAYRPDNESLKENMPEALNGVTIPAIKVELPKEENVEIDMIGLFIYQGRCYVQNEYMNDTSCVGAYVGTAQGRINEWSKPDAYVELSGSVRGDFYEVKGVDPKFMLCMVYENGVVETYIHNNDISLYKGSELVNDRLHLKESYATVSYFTSEEWNLQYQTQKQPTLLGEEHRELFDRFLDAFAKGTFEKTKAKKPLYHLYFTTKQGVKVQFLLLGNGYVSFQGLNEVCVKMDGALYNEIIEVFSQQ